MRSLASVTLAAVGAATLAMTGAAPAHAAPSDIEISIDGGATWYADGAPAIFGDLGSMHPGASRAASILVRNLTSIDAVARVAEVVAGTASPGLVSDLEFHARTSEVNPEVVRDVALGVCIPLLDGAVVTAGTVAAIDLTIAMDETSSNSSQGGTAPIEFVISFVEQTGGALPAVSCTGGASAGGDRPAVMAQTGSDGMSTAGTAVALAIALGGGGLVAFLSGRRRREAS